MFDSNEIYGNILFGVTYISALVSRCLALLDKYAYINKTTNTQK